MCLPLLLLLRLGLRGHCPIKQGCQEGLEGGASSSCGLLCSSVSAHELQGFGQQAAPAGSKERGV